ncbi:methyltransferase domain-containing protein [Paenibacillus sp. 2KB_22]|uniref:methyltransferase domain-containing protein n=1 Tax=Paenibacillus sp. 2KB_22 TaxID=3232978 RepID=UPI003F9E27A5
MNYNDMNKYSSLFKTNIEELISTGYLLEAKSYIEEYELLQKNDHDLFSIKGIIAIHEGDLSQAKLFFEEGLKQKPYDVHLIYNLAYVYELQDKYISAYREYKKLKDLASDEILQSAESKLLELESISSVKEYTTRKKVLIIAYIFPPIGGSGVQRTLKFVKYLRGFGWEPVVLTVGETQSNLMDYSLGEEIPSEIEIIRISEQVEVDINFINRLVGIYQIVVNNQEIMTKYVGALNSNPQLINKYGLLPDPAIVFVKEAFDQIGDLVDFKEIDLIYSTSGPYSDHILGYLLKIEYEKKWVVDFRDEWTNNPYIEYNQDDLIYTIFREMEKNILQSSDRVLSITSHAKSNYVNDFRINEQKIITITNGYDEEDFENLYNEKLNVDSNKKFTIMHNGLLYMIRTPETFLKAVANLLEKGLIPEDRIEILFTQTDDDNKWQEISNEMGLEDNVKFLGYLDHHTSLIQANNCDLLLLIVGPGERNKSIHTGKVFEYLRLGKRILALSPEGSLVEELINDTQRGLNCDFNDIQKMEDYILQMYKQWEAGAYTDLEVTGKIEMYQRKQLTKNLSEVFNEIVSLPAKTQSIQLKEMNSEFYDRVFESGGWNETYYKHYTEIHYYEIWKKAVEIIKSQEDPMVFEIGCGPGQFANLLFDNQITGYIGMDFSSEAIKHAKIRNDKLRSLFYVDDVYKTELFELGYNVAILFEILEHLDGDLEVLSRLKLGTNILFSVPNFYSEGHVRWFKSKMEVAKRYNVLVDIQDINVFDVGGNNKIFLVHAVKN